MSISVVGFSRLGSSLEFEVVSVVLLYVVSVLRVRDIIAPAHLLSEGHSIRKLTKLHVHVVSLVGIAEESVGIILAAPSHEVGLEGTVVGEFKSPVLSNLLVSRVAVQVLLLGHVNSNDLISVSLAIPGVSPDLLTSGAQRVLLSSLV